MIAFCDPIMEEEVSRIMNMHVELLQPYIYYQMMNGRYLKVIEKKNIGC